ncbi:hypothetical protein DPMN_012583 [Dreissena polymorpha]|uniref:Uncharacterized protein n=1 Tax=Dreissena polymorpha TaxID=45954 RepID=A0A9D4N2N7_DREPO|nr:hypothetical protein DPMN_012583 [Dreissena polymorpha]
MDAIKDPTIRERIERRVYDDSEQPLNANIEEKKNTLYQQYVAISSELVEDKKWNIKIQKPLSVQKTVCDVCQNKDPRKFEMDKSSKKAIRFPTSDDEFKDAQNVFLIFCYGYAVCDPMHQCWASANNVVLVELASADDGGLVDWVILDDGAPVDWVSADDKVCGVWCQRTM